MYNILVTGANGQLGSEIRDIASGYQNYNFVFSDREELDITNHKAVENFIEVNTITAIINCAAYTAVDKAESEISIANEINHLAIENFARIAKIKGIKLIHISTDYVFDGKGFQPYLTNHPTSPVNIYGETKLKGEQALKALNPKNSMIIRTSWVYSSFGNNFVKTMLRLGEEKEELNVICDQIGVPTYARDLAHFILNNALKATNTTVATYHYTNEGVCSWYDFAREIMELGQKDCKVIPIPTSAYPTLAKRPFYSLMDKTSLKKEFQVEISYWKESLRDCMENLNLQN
jgi:dTDP-4-dehydrorhamnose reductase